MSSNKKSFLRTVFTSNGSCGCGKAKPFEVHDPIPKPKFSNHHNQNTNPNYMMSSSTTTSDDRNGGVSSMEDEEFTSAATSEPNTTTTHDLNHTNNNNNNDDVVLKKSPLMDSVAIEKKSSDPYHDFRHSMLQMIFEKEIDSEEDLQDLLQCFLQLNDPRYHHVIVEVFNEICEEAFSDKVSSTAEPASSSSGNHIIDRKGK